MNCPRCNLINPDSALRCDCGWDFSKGTVTASYLDSKAMLHGDLATLGERFAGQLIDSLVAILAMLGGAIPFAFSETLGSVTMLGGSVLGFFYILFADGFSGGQSYGKRAMKIAVVDASSGQPCTFMKSFIRNILLSLLGIIDWVFIFGAKRQRLGDMAANTIVIKERGLSIS
jgi:uncharacterized RDD family membrane protein YckC